jgi:hypothetical protein
MNFVACLVLPLQGFWQCIIYIITTRKAINLAFIQPGREHLGEYWKLAREGTRAASTKWKKEGPPAKRPRPTITGPTDFRVEASGGDYWERSISFGSSDWDSTSMDPGKSLDLVTPFQTQLKAPLPPPSSPPQAPLPPPPTYQAPLSLNPIFGAPLPLHSFHSPLPSPRIPQKPHRSSAPV